MSRIRWRMRGALQWPLFAALTVLDAVLLAELPIAGDHTSFAGGLLVAMFFNLVAVAVLAPAAGYLLRRRRRDLPSVVAADRAGSALLALVALGLLAGGLAHRPARLADARELRRQDALVRSFVAGHEASAYRANVGRASTRRQGPGLYRTCVPGDSAAGLPPLCLLVDMHASPPFVHVDPDRTPNRQD